ncbi:glutamine--fructose-6-phosphate transaminase (isomerizing) [Elusimicrobiota bacterium]
MCGIVGYIGTKQASDILIDSLKRLEYRGYDSAGIAIINENNKIDRKRCKGKIANLEEILDKQPLKGTTAIGHTRWATHGKPSDENAHPHSCCEEKIVIVHNGIIENYLKLKEDLITKGHIFNSETDTEVIAHLIEEKLKNTDTLVNAVFDTISELHGSYALGIISSENPSEIIAARKDSPLIIGLSEEGNFIASDVPAILQYTREVIYLEDEEVALLKSDSVKLFDLNKKEIKRETSHIDWDPVMAEKQGYPHFMLKEIHEQQEAVQDTLLGRLDRATNEVEFEHLNLTPEYIKKMNKILMVACGTAYHACLVGKFLFEDRLKIPCEVDIASEFRYRDSPLDKDTLVIAVSQSGETADTLAAMKEAKDKNAKTTVICNVVGSSATRVADGVIYTHAGPEIGVASTKAFTTQLTALYLMTMYLGKHRGMLTSKEAKELAENLTLLPLKINHILETQTDAIEEISNKYFKKHDFLYLGRNINYPIALEGALKLKEISYIHAEGYPAGEMKHGPIALIDEEMPVVVIVTKSRVYEKIISNIEEAKARNASIIAIATEGDEKIKELTDDVIYIPDTLEMLYPLLNTVPLQLIAYHIAKLRGCDIDQPRNLAKSVTVE